MKEEIDKEKGFNKEKNKYYNMIIKINSMEQ